jgi:hypothetical protein
MLRVGATDGFRLAIADVHPAGDIPPDIWAHVSAETARAIRKGRPIPKCDPPDGAYPDLPSVVPAGEPMAVIDLSQSSSIVSAALRACTLDRRFVVSVAAEHDEARVYLPAGVRLIVPARVTTPAEVRIDRDYLADALDAGCTRMEIRGALTPVMLARSGLTCVIMPVRQ